MKKQTRNTNFWGIKSRDKVMPNKLFADSDRDGVPNVFDCRPFNKRRQDYKVVMENAGGDKKEWKHLSREEAKNIYDIEINKGEWPRHIPTTLSIQKEELEELD